MPPTTRATVTDRDAWRPAPATVIVVEPTDRAETTPAESTTAT
jgi:hypothetical protein